MLCPFPFYRHWLVFLSWVCGQQGGQCCSTTCSTLKKCPVLLWGNSKRLRKQIPTSHYWETNWRRKDSFALDPLLVGQSTIRLRLKALHVHFKVDLNQIKVLTYIIELVNEDIRFYTNPHPIIFIPTPTKCPQDREKQLMGDCGIRQLCWLMLCWKSIFFSPSCPFRGGKEAIKP